MIIITILLLRRTSEICIFYTDEHNVDEDMTAIFGQGGGWTDNIWAGITRQDIDDSPTTAFDGVASYV